MKPSKFNRKGLKYLINQGKLMPLTKKQINIAREYARLATRSELSDYEANRMIKILEFIEADECLSLLINEIDEFITQELTL